MEIQIPAKTVEHMKALGYANGFYVEGFVYVRPEADAEGALDVTHSIPVLGWYGNWTDPSMFDTGSTWNTPTAPSSGPATSTRM